MFLSSIFNFESFEGFKPRWPAALLAVCGLVALLEVAARLIPEEALIPAKSRQGEIRFMEREVLPKFERPQVVTLGSSRIRRAVVPKQLDESLALPPNSTLNIGLASGRVFESLHLYKRNREQLKSAKLVILNLDEWHLSSGWRLGSLYEMNAPWSERLEFSGSLRSKLVLDGLFTMRLKLPMLPQALKRKKKSDGPDLKLDENNQILPPPRKNMEEDVDPSKFLNTVATFYDNFEISSVMEGHVAELARMVKEDGGQFVLMQLPNRAAYQSEVNRLQGGNYARHVAALRALTKRLEVPLYFYEKPADCQLSEASYEDYGHINPAGARVFTQFLAELIKREGWIK
jgi:hypothetical protein